MTDDWATNMAAAFERFSASASFRGLEYAIDTSVVTDPAEWTVEQLFAHLFSAAFIELSTIPLYLYAFYSIKGRSYSEWSAGRGPVDDFRTIVIEEMLHLCLVRNMIVAIGHGDKIKFYKEDFLPKYPEVMLNRDPELPLVLGPLSYSLALNVFMEVEKPQKKTTKKPPPDHYFSLGEFYESLHHGFDYVYAKDNHLFDNNHPDLQYGTTYWNEGGGGRPIVITKQLWGNEPNQYTLHPLGAAHKAIDVITAQGEGILKGNEDEEQLGNETVPTHPENPRPGLVEFTHYAKFSRIASGLEPIGIALDEYGDPKVLDLEDAVWPVLYNPTLDKMKGPVRDLAEFFNAAYCYVLALIDEIYNTSSSDMLTKREDNKRYRLERTFVSAMSGMLYLIADQLVRTPCGVEGSDRHAGPPFGFYQFRDGEIRSQLMKLCERSIKDFPSLGGDNSVQWLIGLLPEINYVRPPSQVPDANDGPV